MSKKKLLPILLIIAVAVIYFVYQTHYTSQDEHNVIYGNVDIREVKVAFRQPGRIELIYVEDGDRVKKGELLAEIDPLPLQRQLELSRAKLAVAQAQLADLVAGPRMQEIESAKQEVIRLTATLKNSRSNYFRQKDLRKTGATSIGNLDNAQARFAETNAALIAAKQYLSLLQEGTKTEKLAIARQQVTVAEAQLAIKQIALQDSWLYAPQAGVVLTRIVEPGAMVNAGSPVLSLSLREPLYIRAYINETMLGQISSGDLVTIHTDSSSQPFSGKIGFISPKAEFSPKSVETPELRTSLVYRIRIVVDGDNKGLNQGQPVTISLH
jgi:HlyD family secretion protein